jgi:hypothetical protein
MAGGVGADNVVINFEMLKAKRLDGLGVCAYARRIRTNFCLRKDDADLHEKEMLDVRS